MLRVWYAVDIRGAKLELRGLELDVVIVVVTLPVPQGCERSQPRPTSAPAWVWGGFRSRQARRGWVGGWLGWLGWLGGWVGEGRWVMSGPPASWPSYQEVILLIIIIICTLKLRRHFGARAIDLQVSHGGALKIGLQQPCWGLLCALSPASNRVRRAT